jgi:SNF2 family DNA or RNA helicase
MFNFIRPNVLGHRSEAKFDREFVKPITMGMASNCSANEHFTSLDKARELNEVLHPYVHRVESSELRKDLPPMQQVVIHVRQTRIQSQLYRTYQRYQRNANTAVNYKNFLKQYSSLRPIHNHPVRDKFKEIQFLEGR